uniref:G_PROTEIN_RECEP_F1_2 domain-containing protein n=1 Tax=Toxocara canis TaxID=6265 RepID=A0A183UWI1_TOXCA
LTFVLLTALYKMRLYMRRTSQLLNGRGISKSTRVPWKESIRRLVCTNALLILS